MIKVYCMKTYSMFWEVFICINIYAEWFKCVFPSLSFSCLPETELGRLLPLACYPCWDQKEQAAVLCLNLDGTSQPFLMHMEIPPLLSNPLPSPPCLLDVLSILGTCSLQLTFETDTASYLAWLKPDVSLLQKLRSPLSSRLFAAFLFSLGFVFVFLFYLSICYCNNPFRDCFVFTVQSSRLKHRVE